MLNNTNIQYMTSGFTVSGGVYSQILLCEFASTSSAFIKSPPRNETENDMKF